MTNALRKIVLPATIAIFCALIGYGAYLASNNLSTIKNNAAQRLDASDAQADITAVQLDLQAIETGQHGYLLTGDDSYLAPFQQAVANLPVHFSNLRSRLANRPAEERAIEKDIESVASAKIDEANETIRFRQKGYRHRAFVIVDSNRGKELMDKARSLLSSLSSTESSKVAQYQQQLKGSISSAVAQSALASLVLLAVTVLTLFAFQWRTKRLEVAYHEQAELLRASTEKLEQLTSAVSSGIRGTLVEMQNQAESLLRTDGGFLPRLGQQRVEWMCDASRHLNKLLDEMLEPRRVGESPQPQTVRHQPEAAEPELASSRTA